MGLQPNLLVAQRMSFLGQTSMWTKRAARELLNSSHAESRNGERHCQKVAEASELRLESSQETQKTVHQHSNTDDVKSVASQRELQNSEVVAPRTNTDTGTENDRRRSTRGTASANVHGTHKERVLSKMVRKLLSRET